MVAATIGRDPARRRSATWVAAAALSAFGTVAFVLAFLPLAMSM